MQSPRVFVLHNDFHEPPPATVRAPATHLQALIAATLPPPALDEVEELPSEELVEDDEDDVDALWI